MSQEIKQHIRIRSSQLEMPQSSASARNTDEYDRKLQDAQQEIERIERERQQLEQQKQEIEHLNARKRAFVSQQVELTERLTSALTLIDRELLEIRSEVEDLEQCRSCFASHLSKLEKINPDSWSRENIVERLDRSTVSLDLAIDEYDQAAAHFEGTRSGAIFGRAGKRKHSTGRSGGEFMANVSAGFAYNLPVLLLGSLALIIYLLK